MTFPPDGEYLRHPNPSSGQTRAVVMMCGASSPRGNWCEAIKDHDGPHWFGLHEQWPDAPAESNAERRTGVGTGTDETEGAQEALRASDREPLAPIDPAVSSVADTGVITLGLASGTIMLNADMDAEMAGEIRDMLDDAVGHVGGERAQAELDRLRGQVGRVRELHHLREDIGLDGKRIIGITCAYDDEIWPCPTVQALGGDRDTRGNG